MQGVQHESPDDDGVPEPRTRGLTGRARAIASHAFAETIPDQPTVLLDELAARQLPDDAALQPEVQQLLVLALQAEADTPGDIEGNQRPARTITRAIQVSVSSGMTNLPAMKSLDGFFGKDNGTGLQVGREVVLAA